MSSTTDDQWTVVDRFTPSAVSVDTAGNRWFGYSTQTEGNTDIEGTLRYLDDTGTLNDVSEDVWIDFSADDGLSFVDVADVQVDAYDEVWVVGEALDEVLCSLNTAGTPADKTDDVWTVYTAFEGLAGAVHKVLVDKNSDLWIATSGGLNYLHSAR